MRSLQELPIVFSRRLSQSPATITTNQCQCLPQRLPSCKSTSLSSVLSFQRAVHTKPNRRNSPMGVGDNAGRLLLLVWMTSNLTCRSNAKNIQRHNWYCPDPRSFAFLDICEGSLLEEEVQHQRQICLASREGHCVKTNKYQSISGI